MLTAVIFMIAGFLFASFSGMIWGAPAFFLILGLFFFVLAFVLYLERPSKNNYDPENY